MRDGAPPLSEADGSIERYHLVIVGNGISGLGVDAFYRAAKPEARALILHNRDDFGCDATRNGFSLRGRTELMNGGTGAIDSPRPYSVVAGGFLRRAAKRETARQMNAGNHRRRER